MPLDPQKLLLSLFPLFRHDSFSEASDLIAGSLHSDADWRALTECSGRHRLLGYVCHAVRGDTRLPPLAQREVPAILDGMRMRHAYQRAHAEAIGELLRDIPHLWLKGLALAETAHSHPYLRSSGDIDLLLRGRDILSCLECLCSDQFRVESPPYLSPPFPEWLTFPVEIDEIVLQRDRIILELHTQLVSHKLPHSVDIESAFDSSTRGIFPSLKSEHAWIHLAINHSMHRFRGGLGILLDLARMEDLHPFDASRLWETVRVWRVGYLVTPAARFLASIAPDLVSLSGLRLEPVHKNAVFSAVEGDRRKATTPWTWLKTSPAPHRTLIHDILLSKQSAALRYGLPPDSWKLSVRRWIRPLELLFRHAPTVGREIFLR